MTVRYFSIAIDIPFNQLFTYSSETDISNPIGCRVLVPFGKKQKLALVLEEQQTPEFDLSKIKTIDKWVDEKPILDAESIALIKWAASYYLYPLPAALFTLLPSYFRKAKLQKNLFGRVFTCAQTVSDDLLDTLKRSKKQQQLLSCFKKQTQQTLIQLKETAQYSAPALKQLVEKTLLVQSEAFHLPNYVLPEQASFLTLNKQQESAYQKITSLQGAFNVFLLEGVTGSGKTEVYHHIIRDVLDKQKQVLLLVPEIGLTPQLLIRLRERFGEGVYSLHSGMSATERAKVWLGCRTNEVKILIGTRSSLFSPFQKLGIIIIDEEHDNSLKQQEGFRYHARDLAIVMAKRKNLPVILGTATPSYESYHNLEKDHYYHLKMTERAGNAIPPKMQLVDLNKGSTQEGVSDRLLPVIKKHLNKNNQVMFFINRRGFSPVLMCEKCRWMKDCNRCDSHMTMHQGRNYFYNMKCHHCGSQAPVPSKCPDCGCEDIIAVGQGTERIESYLSIAFPDKKVIRIDRDSMSKKEALQNSLDKINKGEVDILIGTQMLSKGHHFKDVTLVIILNADSGLYSGDYRAFEQTAQQIIQVAGRAGREEKQGEVFIQTQFVENEMLRRLVREGYQSCAAINKQERMAAGFPPAARCILLRAENFDQKLTWDFLIQISEWLRNIDANEVRVLGPAISPIERVAGKYRMQLLVLSDNYAQLRGIAKMLFNELHKGKFGRKIRWSLDVDPVNLS